MENTGRIEIPFGAQNLIIESGKLAKQANGAVTVTCGGTVVLVAACMSKKPRVGIDFFPLMVEYQEKTYSAGRIPGGFFKREGRPTEKEILTSRLIDRPIRPLFPEGLFNEVQVVASVLSHDGDNDPDVMALVGASACLMVSDIPFDGPIGAVRVGLINGEFVVNPTYKQREESTLDFVVAGRKEGVIMIEGEALEIPEGKIRELFKVAFDALLPVAQMQNQLRKEIGKPKTKVSLSQKNVALMDKVRELAKTRLMKAYSIAEKGDRQDALDEILDDLTSDMSVFEAYKQDDKEPTAEQIKMLFGQIEYDEVRRMVFEENRRADGRGLKDIRTLSAEVDVLPRTHGSSLFTRGQTQSLAVITLGTKMDEQLVEALDGTTYRSFMLHYNFPSFSVGETKPMRGPGRREIGHGALAAKALQAILPTKDEFPYTIRIVSEILESNGSSSMATVCASSLALMDAGVPIKDAVSGISVGLITQGAKAVLLTDIMGLEDHFGDMDFKVAGTRKGITAIQLDLKIQQISLDLLSQALEQAKEARLIILDKMHATIAKPKSEISEYAPKVFTCQISPEKIGEVIGPGGKVIKKIIEETGVTSIDIDDTGKVVIASVEKQAGEKAISFIKGMTEEPEIGKIYNAKVKRIMNFGAFCEYLPGREGLVHVSELSNTFVKDVNSVVKVGDAFKVKLIEVDEMKRVNLSKKQAENET
ncbi:MAG: polyribonucleotide nucleotidyltransferase [Omnitrophica WOR_2 bacterium RIFCSPHIGHO2_01_FULL_48_9]|nr:MAG: polyribonucleotide nucleotidyltransferase [Omnitrophica WOR_2 bacterium RIFCSPHIGHO2_02_FULL_48_11]OGX31296.1 MAG: polyribonucleotide nucleotidyltransferase [Omnitrophica WOR_2 bacterium RIFCSPHIGHO2_01_FULL_48_9]